MLPIPERCTRTIKLPGAVAGDGHDALHGGAPSGDGDQWFDLGTEGRYVFEVEVAIDGNATVERFVYETTSVSGGQATVEFYHQLLTYEGEPQANASDAPDPETVVTVTAPVEDVEERLVEEEFSAVMAISTVDLERFPLPAQLGDDYRVGERATATIDGNETVLEVTGTAAYAGIECYVVEERLNGQLRGEMCTRPGFEHVPYVVAYDESGDVLVRVELVEYEA
ncbi:hypothetical protein ACFQE1_15615 [Halobium palmae]|uniref:Uncharacterized protein n=1 Tax=Halobium palmae TaxID=1776492 RepID=A0ABD5S233_9EURY